uniref:procollagen-proline 4-dioxygenase n=1 Tax=Meloidogyne hapla TaxID=6305 RepID=A0A1I8BZ65_MELHA
MNPVNAFLLIKRMASDWKQIERLMHYNMADQFIKNITDGRVLNSVKYPDDEDLDGAALGLLRLQETYKLSTKQLANGYVGNENVGKALTAHDCFEIGRSAYNQKDYFFTLEWMHEALERNPSPELEIEILEFLAYALYQQGNNKRALIATKRVAELAPDHPRAPANIAWYEKRMSAEELSNLENLPPLKNERKNINDIPERNTYENLCRGQFVDLPPKNASKLFCYLKIDKPFLKLAPIKVEIVRYEPLAVLFRNVITDSEIETVKYIATPRLRRATVQNSQTGALEFASYRISKSAWLKGEEHPVIERINKRIHDMTNLELETAEELQVANYGIGGHYDPHFDFSRRGEKSPYGNRGNRIATVLFYMSQPSQGGYTVYTDLGMGVAPSIHDALFWYNLRRDGEGDLRTRHAACPVLTGVKWVSNKWIHERGQEWVRPCPLKQDTEERYVGDIRPF